MAEKIISTSLRLFFIRAVFFAGEATVLSPTPRQFAVLFFSLKAASRFLSVCELFSANTWQRENSLFSSLGHPIIFVEADASPYHQAAGLQKGGPGAKQNAALGRRQKVLFFCSALTGPPP